MAEIRTLEHCSMKTIQGSFSRAFSDYAVPFNPSVEQLQYMLQRRGYNSKLSFGAFENGQLISFLLNGIGTWNGQRAAYDSGTGTVPEYRRKGLSAAVFEAALPQLRANNVTQYLLEVMADNTRAVELYLRTGFKVVRTFDYYVTPVEQIVVPAKEREQYTIKEVTPDWRLFELMWDIYPSWQNAAEAVMRKQLAMKCLCAYAGNEPVGYAIIETHTGDVPQFAVAPQFRRKGVGSALLRELTRQTNSTVLRFANIDTKYVPFKRFMEKTGQKKGPSQFEMLMQL